MLKRRQRRDYEPVRRSKERSAGRNEYQIVADWPVRADGVNTDHQPANQPIFGRPVSSGLQRAYVLSYLALLLFTLILYARAAEVSPTSLTSLSALIDER